MAYKVAYADVDLTYGGLFIDDRGDYADVVEVIDLDSATGTTNMVCVDIGNVSIEYALASYYGATTYLGAQRRMLRQAMEACGPGWHEHFRITGLSRETARMMALAALWQYGHRDIERTTVLATDDEYSAGLDGGWTPEETVAGEDGLREWLSDQYGIESE